MTIPVVAGIAVSCVLAGTGTTAVGYYTPFIIANSIIQPIAAGLMTTITLNSSLVSICCYQALIGFASGLGVQAPQVAAQTTLSHADAPIGLAVTMFAHGLGPAIFATVAQRIFTGRLKTDLIRYAPGLNATRTEDMGLADLRAYIGLKKLEGAPL